MSFCLIIPCYHEEERLPPFLENLLLELNQAHYTGKVLIVDDGSGKTSQAALKKRITPLQERYPHFLEPLLILPKNQGKGGAILAGWAHAVQNNPQLSWLGFVDADGAVSATEVVRCWHQLISTDISSNPAAALYSVRTGKDQTKVERNFIRWCTGMLFRLMVRLRHNIRVGDTQCGHKWLSLRAWQKVHPQIKQTGFAFDVDLTLQLQQQGCSIHTIPINWHESPGSHLGTRSAARLFWQAFTLCK